MTTRRPKRYPLEPQRDAVIADLVVMSQADAATKYGVSRQSMDAFAGRHFDEIVALRERARDAAQAAAITTKVQRRRELERLYIWTLETIKARQRRHAGNPSYATMDIGPLEVVEMKLDQLGGEHYVLRYDAPLVAQARGLGRDVAEEDGEIVRRSESVLTTPEDEDGNARPIPLVIYRATPTDA